MFVFTKNSYGNYATAEGLDMAMALAAMEQNISIILIHEGVLIGIKDQNGEHIGYKDYLAKIPSFPLYDINNIHACSESTTCRNITKDMLLSNIKLTSKAEIINIIQEADETISF